VRFSFWEGGDFLGYPSPTRSNGIIGLEGNRQKIQALQRVTGKILFYKGLTRREVR